MPKASLDTCDIEYISQGEGPCILLVHGFASNHHINWVGTGWVKLLVEAGFRVIALDNRGHGNSSKFYEPDDYQLENMARDALLLLDYLEVETTHIMGYSMGSRISATLAGIAPERLSKVILAGNGYNMISGGFDSSDIRDGLLAESWSPPARSLLAAIHSRTKGARSGVPKMRPKYPAMA